MEVDATPSLVNNDTVSKIYKKYPGGGNPGGGKYPGGGNLAHSIIVHIVSGTEGVPTSVSLGKRMVYLPLTDRSEDCIGNGYAPAHAPAPTPREKRPGKSPVFSPKNHKIFL